jgi:hypothetical protein
MVLTFLARKLKCELQRWFSRTDVLLERDIEDVNGRRNGQLIPHDRRITDLKKRRVCSHHETDKCPVPYRE